MSGALHAQYYGLCRPQTCDEGAEGLKPILRTETVGQTRELVQTFIEKWESKAPKTASYLKEGLNVVLAMMTLPAKYCKRLRTTSMLEQLSQALRQREGVMRIFPNEGSHLHLFVAMLAEMHDIWQGWKYLDMDELYKWFEAKRQCPEGVVVMK